MRNTLPALCKVFDATQSVRYIIIPLNNKVLKLYHSNTIRMKCFFEFRSGRPLHTVDKFLNLFY